MGDKPEEQRDGGAQQAAGESDLQNRDQVVLGRAAGELERLERRMQAARYELLHSELTDLLEQAKASGDCTELESWLEASNIDGSPQAAKPQAAAPQAATPHAATPQAGTQGITKEEITKEEITEQPVASAEQPAARDPLVGETTTVQSAGSSSNWAEGFGARLVRSARARNADRLSASGIAPEKSDEASQEKQALSSPSRKSASRPSSPARVASAAANKQKAQTRTAPNQKVLAQVKTALGDGDGKQPTRGRRRLAGAVISAVAHVLLLVVLAVVTLKLPGQAASLGFESSVGEASESVVELTEPMDAEEPTEQMAEQVQESFDASDALTEMSASLADSLQVPEQVSALSTSAVAANATAASSASASLASAASFFGAAAGGNNFCYVLDVSASMRGGPWEAAKAELLRSLSSLKPSQRYFIICYSRSLNVMPDPQTDDDATVALYATKQNLEHTRRWIERIQINAAGGPPRSALELAIAKEPDAVYLLTDGVTRVAVDEFLQGVNRYTDLFGQEQVQVPIHAIAYYSSEGEALMRRIASQNKGQFIYVPDPQG